MGYLLCSAGISCASCCAISAAATSTSELTLHFGQPRAVLLLLPYREGGFGRCSGSRTAQQHLYAVSQDGWGRLLTDWRGVAGSSTAVTGVWFSRRRESQRWLVGCGVIGGLVHTCCRMFCFSSPSFVDFLFSCLNHRHKLRTQAADTMYVRSYLAYIFCCATSER